ncbi:hypothetical protein CC1G_12371 [Coprinopsis cinerea okayama7|uniref:Uncharacterized protein n=1 Tax=Coprinopsis cinerea (strain Okayama-7 / 130 / ATCC MYA-4618 / FGSC 9003) TaxID=240176 RepID=A8P4H5_COPC7|nr:hypothetical protein CC1G_12371 [Coprinopsis cinerea okayama7\|eukprot:XP_001838748.2 hypothetical protein CC1G_12371 [Coprinopsis cinerea okayama7\
MDRNPAAASFLKSTFATAGVEGLLNGTFLVLGTIAVYLLATRSPSLRASCNLSTLGRLFRTPLIAGSVLLIILITAHFVCTMYRTLHGVTLILSGRSPVAFYDDLSHPVFVLMCLLLTMSISLTDCLLVWRLWIVSNRCIVTIALPTCTALAFFVCGIRVTVFFATTSPRVMDISASTIHAPEISKWVEANILITFITNLYCSSFISFFIYRIISRTGMNEKKYRSVLSIIIESAALWSAYTIFCFTIYYMRSPLTLLSLDLSPAMAGISFMLINVRIGLGWDTTPTVVQSTDFSAGALPRFKSSWKGTSGMTTSVGSACCTCVLRYNADAAKKVGLQSGSRIEEAESPTSTMVGTGSPPSCPRTTLRVDTDRQQ